MRLRSLISTPYHICKNYVRNIQRTLKNNPRAPCTPQYFYIHIPKTAGISLTHILFSHFQPARVNNEYNDYTKIVALNDATFDSYDLVCGHFPYSLIERFPQKPYVMVMLRDPIQRAASHLRHIKTTPDFWLHKHIPAATMSIEEILETDMGKEFIRDQQTRLLGCDFPLTSLSGPKLLSASDENPSAVLSRAKSRLDDALYVGITEQFDDSLQLLCTICGWQAPRSIPQLNVRRKAPKQPLTPRAEEMLRDVLQRDIELYAHAVQLFKEKCANCIAH